MSIVSHRSQTLGNRRALISALAFLLIVCIPIPLSVVLGLAKAKLPGHTPFRKTKPIERSDIIDGNAGVKLERLMQNHSYVGRWLTTHYNELAFRFLRRSTPASWIGRDGWLFVPDRVREFRASHWDDLIQFDAGAIERVDDYVASRGATLVVALIPDRARVYPDKAYRAGQMPPGRASFLPQLAAELREREVNTVDLTDALELERSAGNAPYLPDDHHWTSRGAQAGAEAIVSSMPPTLRAVLEVADETSCAPRWEDRATSESSLVRKLGFRPKGALERQFRSSAPRVEFDDCGWTGDVQAACATYWATSFGQFGSPQFFADAAGCPTRFVYRAGRGSSWAPLEDLPILEASPELGGKHLIVWEVPEYHLTSPPPGLPSAFEKVRRAFESHEQR